MNERFYRMTWIAGLCVIGALLCSQTSRAQQPDNKRVLVIGIDGVRPDALRAAPTPFLDRLISEGSFSDTTQVLGTRYQKNDTVSGPGWSSFLTGVWADKHGVHDNSFEGRNYREFPHFFARIKSQIPDAYTASFVDWEPIDQYIVSGADLRRVFPSKSLESWQKNDAKIARLASHFLQTENPTATMVYFGTVDETGHRFGFHPSVEPYVDAIAVVDGQIGQLLAGLEARPGFANEDWLIIVSTDHGGRGTGHSGGHDQPEIRTTFLIVSGPSAKKGRVESPTYVVDVPVTALTHLGISLDPSWNLDGRPVGLP